MYANGYTGRQIRNELILTGAPQRNKNVKYPWALANLYAFFRCEYYWTGIVYIHWDGETFECYLPQIIDAETASIILKRRSQYKKYPAGNLRNLALAPGKVYCSVCSRKMQVVSHTSKGHTYLYYRCPTIDDVGYRPPGCVGSKRMSLADADIWEKVWSMIDQPDKLEQALETRIAQLQAEETDANSECARLERDLQDLALERQKVITWARKKVITEEDLEIQIAALDEQEGEMIQELEEKRLLIGNRAERLIALAELFREGVKLGYEARLADQRTPEAADRVFKARRKIIDGLLRRAEVNGDKSVVVYLETDLDDTTNDESLSVINAVLHC